LLREFLVPGLGPASEPAIDGEEIVVAVGVHFQLKINPTSQRPGAGTPE